MDRRIESVLSIALVAVCLALATGCAPARLVLPEGTGVALPDFRGVFEAATARCRNVRTMELVIEVAGHVGDTRLRRTTVQGALERPASLRLVGMAPFGPPAFLLVARPEEAVLLLPRDRRIVRDATARELIDVLAGLPLDADDLRAVLTGCVVPDPVPIAGRTYGSEWTVIDLEGEAALYLRSVDGQLVVAAGTRPNMTVDYAEHAIGLPRQLRVRATSLDGWQTEVTASLSQLSVNVSLHPDVFTAPISPDDVPMTVDDLRRQAGPLAAPAATPNAR